jgi:thiamine biosynthesis lipoprotein
LRVAGHAPEGGRWSISIHDPFDDSRELMRVGLTEGAVATSSRVHRTWQRDGQPVHHVIDPRTGSPADIRTAAVTAIARTAWWAEVSATSSLLASDPLNLAGSVSVVAVDEDGSVRATWDLEEVLSCSAH